MATRPLCRDEDIRNGRLYWCVKDPGHRGKHSHQPAPSAKANSAPSLPRRQPGQSWFDPDAAPPAPTKRERLVSAVKSKLGLLSGAELDLAEIDQTADHAIKVIGDRYLLDLAMDDLDRECETFNDTLERFAGEVDGLTRWIDFAEAAERVGHHPAAAYCYAADRFDPEGAAL